MKPPDPIETASKIAVAAAGILLVTVVMLMVFGDRQWKGLETLLTASMLVPLSTVSWPLVEMGGNRMLFGIDAARQAIWRRQQKELAEARDAGREEGLEEGREEGLEKGRKEGREEAYQQGYDAGISDAQRRNGSNGHNRRRRRVLRNDR